MQWVRISALIDFYEAAARRLSRPVEELHWEVCRECVDRTFRTMWRLLLRVTSDEALVARTPVIYAKTYSAGRLETHVIAPGRARIVLSEWPNTPTFVRRGLCIGITTVLSLTAVVKWWCAMNGTVREPYLP